MEVEKALKTLVHISKFFSNLSEEEMLELLRCSTSRVFKDGEVIFREGTRGNELYIIISGSVKVKKGLKTIDVIRVGECFGEMGALSGEERSATMESVGDIVLLVVDEAKLTSLKPEIQAKLFRNILLVVSERLRARLGE
jgi:serine/threonine-protein kinase